MPRRQLIFPLVTLLYAHSILGVQVLHVPASGRIIQHRVLHVHRASIGRVGEIDIDLVFTGIPANHHAHLSIQRPGGQGLVFLVEQYDFRQTAGRWVCHAVRRSDRRLRTGAAIPHHEDKKEGKTYENLLYQIRPAFGGNIVATIVNPEHRPQMATVREGVMKKEILDADYKGEVIRHDVAKYVPETDYVVKVIDRHVEKAKHNLKGAPIVIAGGYGMGSRENFDMLFDLAKELHAEVGASRAAVDAGYADHDRQIGQTGVTVRPKLYIACGISGQIQHIAGMQESGIIISVNNDENAPINAIADYVINGTVEEVIPKMIKYYKKNSK